MLINVRGYGIPLTDDLLRRVEHKVESRLGFAAPSIGTVTVSIAAATSDGGGHHKCCQLRVKLRHATTPISSDRSDRDLYLAVARAVEEARAAVKRALDPAAAVDGDSPHSAGPALSAGMRRPRLDASRRRRPDHARNWRWS